MARGNGEAPAAKVPAPLRALISDIKRPKGGTAGFASQRLDQTCAGLRGLDEKDSDHLLPRQAYRILLIACALHHTSFHGITAHL